MHTMMVREGDERTNAEVERDTMLGAKGIHLREALGLQTLAIEEDDNVGDTIVREKGSWAYGSYHCLGNIRACSSWLFMERSRSTHDTSVAEVRRFRVAVECTRCSG